MKLLNSIFEKYPFFYILYRYNRQKPLYQQPTIFILLLIIIGFYIKGIEHNNDFLSLESSFFFIEICFYMSLIALVISLNNNLVDIKNNGFLDNSLYTNQSPNQIVVGLFFGLSFNLLVLVVLLLFLNTYFIWLITHDFYDVFINLFSKGFNCILIVSFAILIANHIKSTILVTITFILILILFMMREMGLMSIIMGVRTSIIYSTLLPHSGGSFGIVYNKIMLTPSLLDYFIRTTIFLIQSVFTYMFFLMVRKSYQSIQEKSISIKKIVLLFIAIYLLAFIYILLPQITYMSGTKAFNIISSYNGDGNLIIRKTFSSAEAYIIVDSDTEEIYNCKKLIIDKNEIERLKLTDKQRSFILNNLVGKEYDLSTGMYNFFIEELVESKLFSFFEAMTIVKKLIDYKPIVKENISSLIQHLKTMEDMIPSLKEQIPDIEEQLEGYIYSYDEISFTFIWIYVFSIILLWKNYFQNIYTKKYNTINSQIIKHYFSFISLVFIHLSIYYLMLYLSSKDLTFIDIMNIMKIYLPIILYFPIILFASYMVFISRSEIFKKYFIYLNSIIAIIIFIIGINYEKMEIASTFILYVYMAFIAYAVIFYIYHTYKKSKINLINTAKK